jgi:hypothetical protein
MEFDFNLSGNLNFKSGYNQIEDQGCFLLKTAKWNLSSINLSNKNVNLGANKIGGEGIRQLF